MLRIGGSVALVLGLGACTGDRDERPGGAVSGLSGPDGDSGQAGHDGSGEEDGDEDGGDDETMGGRVDLGRPDGGGSSCAASDDLGPASTCSNDGPTATEFVAMTQWSWAGEGAFAWSGASPAIANLTDDDDNGQIDLCDIPDVIVNVVSQDQGARLWVLDGATGTPHFMIDHAVASSMAPAVGDLDGDGLVEIVALEPRALDDAHEYVAHPVAFEHDGALKWRADRPLVTSDADAMAIADVDADGHPEVLVAGGLYSHDGKQRWAHTNPTALWDASTAADLDGDGQLEIIVGPLAYRADGSIYYALPADEHGFRDAGVSQVADIDADGRPELVFTSSVGLTIVEHDGTMTQHGVYPDLVEPRPAAISDIDGDGMPDLAVSHRTTLSLLAIPASPAWSIEASDGTCCAGPAAFDFFADGTPELVYAGDDSLAVVDHSGEVLWTHRHASGTGIETAVIADVDNDGAAEIVYVSNGYDHNFDPMPTVTVLTDPENRWAPARRIWNQNGYHVTNVREDGTIPRDWETLDTVREQAIIDDGVPCLPEPAG